MKRLVFVLFFMALLSSCMYEAMSFLTDQDLEWMRPYELGDTILFISSETMDTMIIDEIELNNDKNPWRENEGSSTYMANSSFAYTIRHEGKRIRGHFCIIREDSLRLTLYLNFEMRRGRIRDVKELQFCSLNLDGVQYDDIIKVDNSNSTLYNKWKFNTEFFNWSKSKGLLQYKYLSGDVYTFYKKLPYKKAK